MGMTRLELLAVIVIIAVLIAVLLPAARSAREAARQSQSRNNLKQIGLALHNYHDVYEHLPAGGTFDAKGRGHHGWMLLIAPFMDASPLYNQLDLDQPWDSPRNAGFLIRQIEHHQIPGQETSAERWEFSVAHYSANARLMGANRWVSIDEIKSQAQTFIAAELAGDFVPWASPYNYKPLTTLNGTPPTYGRYSRDGAHFLFVDGHVEFVTNESFAFIGVSLNGPQLADDDIQARITRPTSFPVPPDTLKPTGISLSTEPNGWHRVAHGLENMRGEIVQLETFHGKSKGGPGIAQDADVAIIAKHLAVEELMLSGNFHDEALSPLVQLTQLRILHLESDNLTEAGLGFVVQLPKLKQLTLVGEQLNEAVRLRLQAQLPGCEVKLGLKNR